MVELKHISAFLTGAAPDTTLSQLQLHMLNGWKDSTLRSYNGAVKKFLVYWSSTSDLPFRLPTSPADIYNFCFWAGRVENASTNHDISANTLSNYLSGLKAWHLFHDTPYPWVTADRVAVMVRALARADSLTPKKPPKAPILLNHLMALYTELSGGSEVDKAVMDCAICAFWGLARLGEFTYDVRLGKPPWLNSVLCSDADVSLGSVLISVRGAKTAKAGQSQHILLNAQPKVLCPLDAVRRRLATSLEPTDSLFGYYESDVRVNLTRTVVLRRCKEVWDAEGWSSLSGHSFRVGGASLRNALGVAHADIQSLGRWTSNCYLIYLRTYTEDEIRRTTTLINLINDHSYKSSSNTMSAPFRTVWVFARGSGLRNN